MRRHAVVTFLRARCFVLCFSLLPALGASTAHAAAPLLIMPLGDSITVGVDYATHSAGGYRDPLLHDLSAAGISFTFTGAGTSNSTTTLTAASQAAHNGYGSWHLADLNANLDGVAAPVYGGDNNNGGYFLTGGHGTGRAAVTPDIVLLHAGTNDLLQQNANLDQDLYTLVTHIHALSPGTVILVAGVVPINGASFVAPVNAYNSYIRNQLVPALSYTRYVDQNTSLLNADGSVNASLIGTDNVHPNHFGYTVMAQIWAAAIKALEGVTPSTHPLTVNGGTGSGNFPAGAVVTVSASAVAGGTQFGGWTPATTALSNPYSALATYTMPAAAATLTASSSPAGSPIVPNGTYDIPSAFDGLVMSAAGSGDHSAAQQQTYGALGTQKWDLTNLGGNLVSLMLTGTNEALEVPAANAASLSAALDVAPYTGATNQRWTITPTVGSMELVNGSSGQAVILDGYSTAPGTPLLQYTTGYLDELWNFFPAGTPAASYALTVNNGTGGGSYPAGTTVTVVANAAPAGYSFAGWTGATNGMQNAASASTTLVTGAGAASITATYAPVAEAPAPPAPAPPAPAPPAPAPPPPAPSAVGSIVSIQFVGGGTLPLHGAFFNFTAGAGSFATTNWNSVLNTGNSPAALHVAMASGLTDSTGAASSIGFDLRASGAYSTGAGTGFTPSSSFASYFLYAGFAYAGYSDKNPLTLTVSGLNPARNYSLLVYVAPFENLGDNQSLAVGLAGAATYYATTTGKAGSYQRVSSTTTGSPGTGNYVEFDGVYGSATQIITLTNTSSLVGMSGIQIVDMGAH